MLRGRGRGGGEYTVLEVRGYPGDVVQYIGDVPPGLNRKCLGSGGGGMRKIKNNNKKRNK